MGSQYYLPPDRGDFDFPTFTPAKAGTRFSDPKGMQGWVDLGGGYIPKIVSKIRQENNPAVPWLGFETATASLACARDSS